MRVARCYCKHKPVLRQIKNAYSDDLDRGYDLVVKIVRRPRKSSYPFLRESERKKHLLIYQLRCANNICSGPQTPFGTKRFVTDYWNKLFKKRNK